jgi:hypothetical protein
MRARTWPAAGLVLLALAPWGAACGGGGAAAAEAGPEAALAGPSRV